MHKKYSRKDFIKLGTLAGTGLLLAACGANDNEEQKKTIITKSDSATIKSENIYKVRLIKKDDSQYEELRKGYNKCINKFPLVIALCTTTADVVEAMNYANENNLAIAVKSGGHSLEGFSSNDSGMVINLSKMNTVEFLAENRIKIGPGCTVSELYNIILPKKRIIPIGSCGTVGLGGLTLGGGYGLFSRKYGLTCDNLLEATMVDGNGKIHSTKDDPELLWALRGGGSGNFGVVTELIYKSYTAPAIIQAHHFKAKKLNAERAKNILEKWFEFAAQLPNSCFSAYVLNGNNLTILVTNFEKHTEKLQTLLDTLALETDEYKTGGPGKIAYMLKNYYGSLVPIYFKNSSAGLYKNFDEISEFISDILHKSIHTPGMMFQMNTLGGNIANPEFEKVSCYPHRAYNFIAELQAYWYTAGKDEKLKKVSKEILDILSDNKITAQYINYCSLDFEDWETAYYGNNYKRLQAVKREYDSNNIIHHPQSIKA